MVNIQNIPNIWNILTFGQVMLWIDDYGKYGEYLKKIHFLAASAVVDRGAESQNSWCEGLDTDSGYQASLCFIF